MISPFPTLEHGDLGIDGLTLRFVTVRSRALGRRVDALVCVPQAITGCRHAAVITLLHGVYGSHWTCALKGNVHRSFESMIHSGRMPPAVLVLPSDGLIGDGSGYVPQVDCDPERWIVEELPVLVQHTVPEVSSDSRCCIAGLSMGGWGALRIAARHPGRYAAAAAHSAITEADDFDWFTRDPRRNWRLGCNGSRLLDVMRSSRGLPPLRFDCGAQDELLDSNRLLHEGLITAGIPHTFEVRAGGHDWAYWEGAWPVTLEFFAAILEA